MSLCGGRTARAGPSAGKEDEPGVGRKQPVFEPGVLRSRRQAAEETRDAGPEQAGWMGERYAASVAASLGQGRQNNGFSLVRRRKRASDLAEAGKSFRAANSFHG